MNIPSIVEVVDTTIERVMTYKFIKQTKNGLLVYENIKTGIKECFLPREFNNISKDKVRIIRFDIRKDYLRGNI